MKELKKENILKKIAIIMCFVYVFFMVKMISQKEYQNTFLLVYCICVNLFIIVNTIKKFIPMSLTISTSIITFVFATTFMGSILGLYASIHNYDDCMHFLSGIIIASIGYDFIKSVFKKDFYEKLSRKFIIFFVIIFNQSMAAFWEISEFCIDKFLGQHMQGAGLIDTMMDMIDSLFACILAIIIIELRNKIKQNKH